MSTRALISKVYFGKAEAARVRGTARLLHISGPRFWPLVPRKIPVNGARSVYSHRIGTVLLVGSHKRLRKLMRLLCFPPNFRRPCDGRAVLFEARWIRRPSHGCA